MNPTIASPLKVGILKGVQILVVDNDVDSRVLYTIFLEHFGANVMTAGSIKEALEILSWFIPNIIICEIRFLGESVYTLFNRLSAMEVDNNNHIPVIVTSTCTTSTNNEIPEIEPEKYLLKPVDLDELILMIINLLVNINNILSAYELKPPCNNQIKLKEGLAVEADILLTT
ncbi:response regulator [Nostoc sp. UHCC 0302]|uniref:response regulator n=1 Tax=Nostoc sp. UHCC 0302 TaxID=3134896 RepID=UPI00311CC5CF